MPRMRLAGFLFVPESSFQKTDTNPSSRCYTDDWVILAPTRWKLRKAIALMNQTLYLYRRKILRLNTPTKPLSDVQPQALIFWAITYRWSRRRSRAAPLLPTALVSPHPPLPQHPLEKNHALAPLGASVFALVAYK